jgi:hypothetical protein
MSLDRTNVRHTIELQRTRRALRDEASPLISVFGGRLSDW